jgi:hypothetical protein
MKISTPIKILAATGIILWGCFETLQFFNRQDALKVGNDFLKTHNATVEYINCEVPANWALYPVERICVFNAKPDKIQLLIRNLDFHIINTNLSSKKTDKLYEEASKQDKLKKDIAPQLQTKIDDLRKISDINRHSCLTKINSQNSSDIEVYGRSENRHKNLKSGFFVFYKPSSKTGCFSFESDGI